ncbi:MAG TPA: group II intron reverse transcriptase/maturase [Chloroflexi bacterium]|nr:group II intron reverse transcriptase/maturase [Chloroflexota bacterium]
MADVNSRTEDWNTLPWKDIRREVFRLQQRIYRAARQDDLKRVHSLQRLLLRSWSARCLAVRRVTQDNRGKKTPGVDGIAALTPRQRMQMVAQLRDLSHRPALLRRVYIPKPGKPDERRPLAIPTLLDRAYQTLVKLALEPEWEARFEPNSYGFRPGRSPHDAIEAVFNFIRLKPKYVLDADITRCFDCISHDALLQKLHTIRPIERLVRGRLKAGILDHDRYIFPQAGTPQGGPLSPLLANIALHGLETALRQAAPAKSPPGVIRYADDFVVLHADLDVLLYLQGVAAEWLAEMGLELHPEKTHISHTLIPYNGQVGFDFLGFHIRRYPVGKYHTRTFRGAPGFKTIIKPGREALQRHRQRLRETIRQYRGASQAALIHALNPLIQGWANYYQHCVAKHDFQILDNVLYHQLMRWARYRHPRKSGKWCYHRYWRRVDGRVRFSDGESVLSFHQTTVVSRFVKVRGDKSPFDGDWVYWSARLGREPTKSRRVTRLLRRQRGRCAYCGLRFVAEDVLEVHHHDGNHTNNAFDNLRLLHGHCHDVVHGKGCQ